MPILKSVSFCFSSCGLRCCECLYSVEWLSDTWMMSSKDLEEAGSDVSEVMSRNFLGRTQRSHETPHSWLPVSRPRFEVNTSQYKSKIVPPCHPLRFFVNDVPDSTASHSGIHGYSTRKCCHIYFSIYLRFVALTVVLILRFFWDMTPYNFGETFVPDCTTSHLFREEQNALGDVVRMAQKKRLINSFGKRSCRKATTVKI
jgi:hypothetical protein